MTSLLNRTRAWPKENSRENYVENSVSRQKEKLVGGDRQSAQKEKRKSGAEERFLKRRELLISSFISHDLAFRDLRQMRNIGFSSTVHYSRDPPGRWYFWKVTQWLWGFSVEEVFNEKRTMIFAGDRLVIEASIFRPPPHPRNMRRAYNSFVPLSFAFIFRFSTSRKTRLVLLFCVSFRLAALFLRKMCYFSSPLSIVCAVLAWRKIGRVAGGQASRERCSHEPPIKGEWLRTCDIDKTFLFYFFNKIFIFFN